MTPVHTTGVNLDSFFAIVGSISGVIGVITAIAIAWGAKRSKKFTSDIASAINQFRIDVIMQLDNRLTKVESKLDDIKQNTKPGTLK